jgi:ADP-ribose pyrophosphatase YjhB (NUDIX family)
MKSFVYCPYCSKKLVPKSEGGELNLFCAACNEHFWQNPKPVVSILLFVKDKVLLLQRSTEPFKDYWVLPGGFIKYEETPAQAVIRETQEETGLTPQITGLIGVYQIDNDPRGMHIDIIYAGTVTGDVHLSLEDKAFDYFPLGKLPDQIAYKHRQAIAEWFRKGEGSMSS